MQLVKELYGHSKPDRILVHFGTVLDQRASCHSRVARGGTINRKCALSITAVEGHYQNLRG